MNYTRRELVRVSPKKHGWRLFLARAHRLWKGYLRLATGLAGVLGGLVLMVQYFVILPMFALLAKRAARSRKVGSSQPNALLSAPVRMKIPHLGPYHDARRHRRRRRPRCAQSKGAAGTRKTTRL